MISAVCWIPKGASKTEPVVVEPPSKEEIEEILKSGTLERRGDSDEEQDEEMEVDAPKQENEVAQALAAAKALGQTGGDKSSNGFEDIADSLRELDMDHYDDEDDGIEIFSSGQGDTYYTSNDMDPYLQGKDEDDEEEVEDMTIKPTDAVIVCARSEDEVNLLEVSVFEELEDGDKNIFVHHEYILPDFPLCVAWLDCNLKSGEKGNFIAVGSMEPAIEIWDLDLIDEVKPFMVLGGKSEKKKPGKKKSVKYKKGSHTGAVLGLAWNKEFRNVLASASADESVKVWDIAKGTCETLKHHDDKVQAVAWSQHSPALLLSGSFDKSVALMDMRSDSNLQNKWSVEADVESLAWDPHNEHSFLVSLENGTVQGFDTRADTSKTTSGSRPSFTLHAHDKAVTSVSYCPFAANLLATASTDKMVKLWDLSNNQPSCLASKNPKAGSVFSISFSDDSPFLLAIGGSKGKLQVWDTMSEPVVGRRFGKYNNRRVANTPSDAGA